ncbi:C3a anaphylatoxin chemotactic receptor-like [Phyllobates terribilis]|uniref:C3a anaphylatoxin chemotactic receptor-like n=1 Tax=Phyllobates terribilis TaxID=111132 RepID=UPI003CCB176D
MDNAENNLTTSNSTLDYYGWSSAENEEYNYYLKIILNIAITLCSILFVLGIIGNGLVIWIAGFRMKNTISAVWFLNLAIADFLCCASLSLRIAELAAVFAYVQYFVYCILNMFLFTLNMSASVLLLTAMSIDRWVSVMWPIWAKIHRTGKLVRISAAIIWGLSLILTGLVYTLYRYHVGDLQEWCVNFYSIHHYNPKLYHTIQLIRLVIMFVIPFLIIFTTYVTIFYKLRKSKRSQRSSRIITAVILCFFICWFPYYIWPLISGYYRFSIMLPIVQTIITTLAYLNSCINPILYAFMGRDFQQGFLRSIPSRLERALGDHPNDLDNQQNNI